MHQILRKDLLTTVLINVLLSISQIPGATNNNIHPFRPGGQRHLLVSLYQKCSSSNTSKRTLINREAEIAYRTAKSIFDSPNEEIINDQLLRRFWSYHHIKDRGFTIDDIEFLPYDVCDEQDLAFVVSEILLNQKFYLRAEEGQEYPSWRDSVISGKHWRRLTRILAVIVYADNWLVQRLKLFLIDIKHYLIFTAVTLNQKSLTKDTNENQKFRLAGDRAIQETIDLIELFDIHKIRHTNLIYLKYKQSTTQQIYFDSFIHLYNNTKRCFNLEIIDQNSINETRRVISILRQASTTRKFVLLFGEPNEQAHFINYALTVGLDNITWILRDVDAKRITVNILVKSYVYTYLYVDYLLPKTDTVEKETTILNSTITLSNISTEDILKDEQTDSIMLRSYQITTKLLANYHRITVLWPAGRPKDWLTFKALYEYEMTSRREYGRMFRLQWNQKYKEHVLKFNNTIPDSQTTCPIILCPRGWVRAFGHVSSWFSLFDYSQGWTCHQCPVNHFKPNIGDGQCQACPMFTISNNNRSLCIDPYTTIYIWFNTVSVKLFLLANTACILVCIFIMVVFFVYHKTPVVITSDYKLSQIHLFSLLMTFITLPFMFLGIPRPWVCTIKPALISATSGISLSIIVMKSHKMLRAYKSKVRLTRKQRDKSVRLQAVSIVLLILIGQAVNYVVTIREPPTIVQRRQHFKDQSGSDVYQKITYCDSSLHVHAQIIYFMALQFLALFKAFQGRKLPTILNDAIAIIYAIFINTLIYSVMFPIYFFQENKLDGVKVHWLCLLLSNFVFMVIFYGNRIRIILFNPNKNTKVYYRIMMMVNAKQRAHRGIQKTQLSRHSKSGARRRRSKHLLNA